MKQLAKKRLFLLDMDGTIYLDQSLFPGTIPFLNAVRAAGGRYLFLTNNSSRSVDAYITKLDYMGIPAVREDFLTSVDALTADLARRPPYHKCYAFGTRSFRQQLAEAWGPEDWYVGNLLEGNRDERLLQYIKERFGKNGNRVSGVFLTGTDLNTRDYKKSREEICSRRRVFLGDLLHARGACMLAGDLRRQSPYLYLSEQTLLFNVGIRSSRGDKEEISTIVSAGCSWYEAEGSCEVLLHSEPLLEFSFQSMLGGEPIQAGMHLTDLPDRPQGTSRLRIEVHFPSPVQCEIKVTDLGFGELYPSSDLCWKESFMLEEQEEVSHGTGYTL